MRCTQLRGLTLMEVVLVIFLLGMMTALVWPDFDVFARQEQLNESVRRMRTMIAMCRAQAMNQARGYRITIRLDGTIRVTKQIAPLDFPELYAKPREDWSETRVLLDGVWVESLMPLPEGPPPMEVDDDLVEFPELEEEPIFIEELELPFVIEFRPDGTCTSLRWTLREDTGRGIQLTLDGRVGRVAWEEVERLDPEEVIKPEPIPPEDYELAAEETAEQWLEEERRR